jgi:uncharacterized protein YdhG (YjbR/CyaY superfamily)
MVKPENMDAYIAGFPKPVQEVLQQLRKAIHEAAPETQEKIAYGMPAFRLYGRDLIYFAAFKNHIGLYALPSGNIAFRKELEAYKTGKGSIQFPLDKPMPWQLIAKIIRFRIQENLQRAKGK